MEIRLGKIQEKDALRELWKYIFDEDEFYLDYKFSNDFSPLCSCVAYDSKIVGSVHFDTCYINNEKVAYLNGVSVLPDYRNRHIASKMLDFVHSHLKDNGYAYCFLKPAISNFYEKFGYFTVFKGKDFILPDNRLKDYTTDETSYSEIFSEMSKKSDAFLPRSEEKFRELINLYKNYGGNIVCFKEKNKPVGFCLYCHEDGQTLIEEFVSLNDNCYCYVYDYFNGNVKIKELPVMVKTLNKPFPYKNPFIKVI